MKGGNELNNCIISFVYKNYNNVKTKEKTVTKATVFYTPDFLFTTFCGVSIITDILCNCNKKRKAFLLFFLFQ